MHRLATPSPASRGASGLSGPAATMLRFLGWVMLWVAAIATSNVIVPTVEGQALRVDHLTNEDGLSQLSIMALHQDRLGFMWIGTEDGLNRYDGQEFRVYEHRPDDQTSLSQNWVWAIDEGDDGVLWVGTNQGGLNRFDPTTDSFERIGNRDPEAPQDVRAVEVGASGDVWIGSELGLSRLDPRTRACEAVAIPGFDRGPHVLALLEDGRGTLWVGTLRNGLFRLDSRDGVVEAVRLEGATEVRSLFASEDGRLLVGTVGHGLFVLDRAGQVVENLRHLDDDPTSLSNDAVHAVLEDRAGALWVGTDSGLNLRSAGATGFARYYHQSNRANSLAEDLIKRLYQDRGGVVWIGTHQRGLDRTAPLTNAFAHYTHDPAQDGSLSHNAVTSFATDASGDLWIGTLGGGLNRMNDERDVTAVWRHDPEDPASLSDNRTMALLADRRGDFWVGTFDHGLNRLRSDGRSFDRFVAGPPGSGQLPANGVMSLYEDPHGDLWVGTFRGGLSRFERSSETFESWLNDPLDETTLGSDLVADILASRDGRLWLGTMGRGLDLFDPRTGKTQHFRHDPDDPYSLSDDRVTSLLIDRTGTLWIGSQFGLSAWSRRDREAGRPVFRRFTTEDGLADQTVYGLLEDDQGYLWISSNGGLSRFDPVSEHFSNYGREHGLQGEEFNFGAYHRAASGEMFFGGSAGFNTFWPDQVDANRHVPPVMITSFRKLNREVELPQPIWLTDEVEIDYRDYVVSFEFAALDYLAPSRNQFAYKLEGFDREWISIGNERRATYTNLDGGHYTLRVRAANNDGVWNEEGASLGVRVVPAPWKTWWAYLFYFGAVCGVFAGVLHSHRRKMMREKEYSSRLEEEVRLRTQDLHEAANSDALTGLRNRRYLMSRLEEDFEELRRGYADGRRAVDESQGKLDLLFLMIDLDGLKKINDDHGHAAGDRAILQMRDVLQGVCRKSDTLIRWGGDEFLVVSRDVSPADAESMAERLRAAFTGEELVMADGSHCSLSCSIGYAFFPFHPEMPAVVEPEQVVNIADRALYVAKTSGRNAWVGVRGTQEEDGGWIVSSDLDTGCLRDLAAEKRIEVSSSLDIGQLVWT